MCRHYKIAAFNIVNQLNNIDPVTEFFNPLFIYKSFVRKGINGRRHTFQSVFSLYREQKTSGPNLEAA